MKVVVVGLGIQGNKRFETAGREAVATVDPGSPKADFRSIQEVPLKSYDAALVCTPDDAKLPIVKFLLSSGKHVMVEKPLLAARDEELEELLEIAESRRLACYTAYNHRFEPQLVRLKRILQKNALGEIYTVKFFYGNGTARDVRQSAWRDQGCGVLTDLGSHLLDSALFLFGKRDISLEPWRLESFENRAFDYAIAACGGKPLFQFEMTLLSWKNTFRIDIVGEKGSVHVNGLCKWGPSTLEIRKRVLPSGRPKEKISTLCSADPTWEKEYIHFKKLCRTGGSNLENDVRINSAIQGLMESAAVRQP